MDSYLLFDCLTAVELEAINWMATREYYRQSKSETSMKSETRTTFLLFSPQTHAVIATD